ncbi:hypothetical protein COOONC_07323 [Cooperia oncophora]
MSLFNRLFRGKKSVNKENEQPAEVDREVAYRRSLRLSSSRGPTKGERARFHEDIPATAPYHTVTAPRLHKGPLSCPGGYKESYRSDAMDRSFETEVRSSRERRDRERPDDQGRKYRRQRYTPTLNSRPIMWFYAVMLMTLSLPSFAEKAEVNIRVSGACSPVYLQRKGIDMNKYHPSIRFNPDRIHLVPKNPVIPGCIKIKAEGVEITRPLRNLIAEVELRIGGTPNPSSPTLPCSRKIDEKINQCFCSKIEGTCVFCDFCKQLKAQSTSISATKQFSTHKSIDDCKCGEMLPGMYDIETEMCTPDFEDVKDYIPPEIQANVLDKKPISMFITVYLMDLEPRNESYLSAFGRAILQRRMAQSTVACFLLGIDVNVALPQRT